MVDNRWQAWSEYERDVIAREEPNLARNLAIADALLVQARLLGVWPPEDPLDGIEVDIRLARLLNVRRAP